MSAGIQTSRAVETFQFKGTLAEVATKQEFVRAEMVRVCLRDRLVSLYVTVDECLSAIYGTLGVFWEIECSEPVKWARFTDMFALLVAKSEADYDVTRMAVASMMLDAYREGADLFTGDVTALDRAEYGWQVNSDRLKVDVRRAGTWLAGKPKRAHLMPPGLRLFLEQAPRQTARGAGRPKKMETIKAEMRGMAAANLQRMKEKEMEARFGASRATCRDARRDVLAKNGK